MLVSLARFPRAVVAEAEVDADDDDASTVSLSILTVYSVNVCNRPVSKLLSLFLASSLLSLLCSHCIKLPAINNTQPIMSA